MALFEITQDYENEEEEWKRPTFKDCAKADISLAFFNLDEHAETHTIDGKEAPVIIEESTLREHSAHWEAGAKQNFDTGLYTSHRFFTLRQRTTARVQRSGKTWLWTKARSSNAPSQS